MINPLTIEVDTLYVNGDSWTYGSELRDPTAPHIKDDFNLVHDSYRTTHYWPKLLADQLNLKLVDGSQAGSGNDRILRTSLYDIAQLIQSGKKPLVIVSWSQLHRFELPTGDIYRSYVNPKEANIPKCVEQIWAEHSSDYTDVVRWAQQVILLDSYLKVNRVSYLGCAVFKELYWLFEKSCKIEHFQPYLKQLISNVNIKQHVYNFSLESILLQHEGILYGPGGHPLRDGHQVLSNHLEKQIRQRFSFDRMGG